MNLTSVARDSYKPLTRKLFLLGACLFFSVSANAELPGPKLRYGLTLGPSSYRLSDLSLRIYLADEWTLTPAVLFGKTSSGLSNAEFDLTPSYRMDENNIFTLDLRFYRDETEFKSNIFRFTYDYNLASRWDTENRTWVAGSLIVRRDTEPGPPDYNTSQLGVGLSISQELSKDWSIGTSLALYGSPSTSIATTPSIRRNGRGRGLGSGGGGNTPTSGGTSSDGNVAVGDFSPGSGYEKYSQSFFTNGWVSNETSLGFSIGRYAYYGDTEATWSFTPSAQHDFSKRWTGEFAWSHQKAPNFDGANYVTLAASYYFD